MRNANSLFVILAMIAIYAAAEASSVLFDEPPIIVDCAQIKEDLNGMSADMVEKYAQACIAEKKIFFYSGGNNNLPLVEKRFYDLVWGFKTVSVGVRGGIREAQQFNGHMLYYARQNAKDAEILGDDWTGKTMDDLRRAGYESPLRMGIMVETGEEWAAFKRDLSTFPDGTVIFYFKDGYISRWEKFE